MLDEILQSKRHYTIYMLGFYIVFSSYFVLKHYLEKYSPSFHALPKDKKMYVVSNFVKAGILAILSPYVFYFLYSVFFLHSWDTTMVRNLGNIYAIPDGVSLLLVRKMSTSTKVHHVIVCIFNVISLHNDYGVDNVLRCMPVYASLSSLSYLVNFLLGCRYLDFNKPTIRKLSIMAMVIYICCCFTNWIWHTQHLYILWKQCDDDLCHVLIPTYCGFIAIIIWDDIILNCWLYRNARKKLVPKAD